MTRAVVDVNVVVAAAIRPGGAPAECMRAYADGRFELVVSPQLLAELRDVLARPKLRAFLALEHGHRLADALERGATVVRDPSPGEAVSRDPGDEYLIALARAASAHVLVTGDRDLVGLELPDLRIVAPREFLDLLP